MACRCLKIGLILPTETTNGAIVLAAIASGLDSASPQHFYDILNSWKRKLKGKREKFAKNTPVQLTEYPESVDLLPENLKVSYNEDPPEPLTLEQCLHVNNMEALRKSSSKLGGRNLALQASGVASSGSGGLKNPDPVMMMGSMLTQCLQMMQASMGGGSNSASSSQASNLPGLHIFTPSRATRESKHKSSSSNCCPVLPPRLARSLLCQRQLQEPQLQEQKLQPSLQLQDPLPQIRLACKRRTHRTPRVPVRMYTTWMSSWSGWQVLTRLIRA